MDRFVRRENVKHYRDLLREAKSAAERQRIQALLDEELRKQRDEGDEQEALMSSRPSGAVRLLAPLASPDPAEGKGAMVAFLKKQLVVSGLNGFCECAPQFAVLRNASAPIK